jgi:hypothetical protein
MQLHYVRQWHTLENCGKSVVTQAAGSSTCGRTQMLMVEATFANMMITTATFCGDTCEYMIYVSHSNKISTPTCQYVFLSEVFNVRHIIRLYDKW